jgi:hypothetical protein
VHYGLDGCKELGSRLTHGDTDIGLSPPRPSGGCAPRVWCIEYDWQLTIPSDLAGGSQRNRNAYRLRTNQHYMDSSSAEQYLNGCLAALRANGAETVLVQLHGGRDRRRCVIVNQESCPSGFVAVHSVPPFRSSVYHNISLVNVISNISIALVSPGLCICAIGVICYNHES